MSKFISLVEFTQRGIENVDYYGTLGAYDLVVVTEFPDAETAASVLLSTARLGNVRTKTLRAFAEREFRDMVTDLP